MGELIAHPPNDQATAIARHREDVAVGDEIVRHRLSSRVIHWAVAVGFTLCLFTGLPIWSPVMGWMAAFFGGLTVCAWLHRWSGLFFVLSSAVMFFQWAKEMVLRGREKEWLGPKLIEYLKFSGEDPTVGKYNGGQKLLFWLAEIGAVALLLSGLVLWFPLSVPVPVREVAIVLHDLAFIAFTAMIIGHIYLGTAAEPGTFGAMTHGTVKRRWAQLHHPAWVKEVDVGKRK